MDMPLRLKRPKPGDGDKEIALMQEEFNVINLQAQKRHKNNEPCSVPGTGMAKEGKIRSKFAESRAFKQQQASESGGQMINPAILDRMKVKEADKKVPDFVQNVPMNPSTIILGNVVEKKVITKLTHEVQPKSTVEKKPTGFPEVFVVDHKGSSESGSLFWRKISGTAKNSKVPIISKEIPPSKHNDNNPVEDSMKQEIHQMNLEKLNEMSQEEILAAKLQLENVLSPDMIKFIKAKKNNATRLQSGTNNSNSATNKMKTDQASTVDETNMKLTDKIEAKLTEETSIKMECDIYPVEKETPAGELVEQATTKGWVHMDTIEPEKLEWMKDVTPSKDNDPKSEEPYNARFDFNGVLLPFKDDNLSLDKGLHHHGEEPERPGYSLQELLQLSRSSTQQQRCTALNTLANIMEKSREGWYDEVVNPAPLVALSERNILLLLRLSIDDTSVAVVTAALQALRAFLYSEADEICLDRLVGWKYNDGKIVEPELPAPKTDVKDTRNLKDHELAQLDTIAAAMRSDIVLRIRYILSELHPPPIGVTAALQILTRLARHSRITTLNIACTPNLLDTIVHNFIPMSTDRSILEDGTMNAYGVPSATAVRLCRILVTYAGKPVADKLNNLHVVHSLLSYTTNEAITTGIRLSIESLRLWKNLLSHEVALDSTSGPRLSFFSQLQLLLSNHDLGSSSELACEYAGALIDVAVYESSLRTTVSTLYSKWSTQLSSLSSPTWSQTKLVAQTATALGDVSSAKCGWISNGNVFASLCTSSNLLSGYVPAAERDPTSLPNLGALTENGKLQPALSLHSCIPFLATWINSFHITGVKTALNNQNFSKYIDKLSNNDWSLETSWYTRAELYLATGIVRAGIRLDNLDNDFANQMILKIAIKLISSLPCDASNAVREILNIILSNDRLFLHKLSNDLDNLKLNVSSDNFFDLPNNLSSVYDAYISSTGSWNEAAMPKDWLYLPLVAAYTNHKEKFEWKESDTTKVIAVLSLQLCMPEVLEELSPSLRFSRLILIYLCDTVYLEKNVSILLKQVLTDTVKKYYKKFDFTSDLPGLSSFTDLFTSLCECFYANSYGDDVFSMALLVPLAQRHDVHYRKSLWSEHAAALRYLRLKEEELVIPLREYFYPIEEDPTLIESYLTALVRGTVKSAWCPLMYRIALHHSAMFIKGDSKLAVRMRTKIGQLRANELSNALLNYIPPEM